MFKLFIKTISQIVLFLNIKIRKKTIYFKQFIHFMKILIYSSE